MVKLRRVQFILGLFLAIILILGLCGCMGTILKQEEKAVLEYLENKYSEEFVVESLSRDYAIGKPNKAYVHPVGREHEWFMVSIYERDGVREYSDGYSFVFASQAVLPEYESWVVEAIPGAKIVVNVCNGTKRTREKHDRNASFDEFAEKESHNIGIDINIFLDEKELKNKENLFEQLSHSLYDNVPRKDIVTETQVIFIKSDIFNTLVPHSYRGSGAYEMLHYDKIAVAYTRLIVSEGITQEEILKRLELDFEES